MGEREKDLRVEIVHLREDLLFSEGQLFYRLRHLLSAFKKQSMKAREVPVESGVSNVETLQQYKNKLLSLRNSPFKYLVDALKAGHNALLFVPRHLSHNAVMHELGTIRPSTMPADIVNFGVIPYAFRKLRQQHLAEELGKLGHRVFYIENRFNTSDKYKPGYSIRKVAQYVYAIRLNAVRDVAIYHQQPTQEDIRSICQSYRELARMACIKHPVLKIDHPFWTYVLPFIKGMSIYDCMDDYSGFEITGKHILVLENKLIRQCDLTVACSRILLEKVQLHNPKKTLLLKNACEYEHFAVANKQSGQAMKIIGFFGALGEWVDEDLLGKLATAYPQAEIRLIGEVQNEGIERLRHKYPNIKLLGEKPYQTLPGYLKDFDVCIVPFKVNQHTELIDPVKLYEYFASGKPVITTAIKEIKNYGKAIYYSTSVEEFIKNIKKAVDEKGGTLPQLRKKIAGENTWKMRATALHEEIDNLSKK